MDFHIQNVPIAFFDLDDTLIDKDTNSLWLRWRMKKNIKGLLELIIGLHNYFYLKRGKLTERKMKLYFWARTLGIKSDTYKKMSFAFFNEEGKYHIYTDAVKLIEAHKKKGIHVVIITGQDDYLTYPFFNYFKMDGCISNKRIVKKEAFVGFEKPNCYGEGKIILARNYAKQKSVNLQDCAFYSDSISDLPLFMEVKYPVAVNPDPDLKKIVNQSSWQTYNFRQGC